MVLGYFALCCLSIPSFAEPPPPPVLPEPDLQVVVSAAYAPIISSRDLPPSAALDVGFGFIFGRHFELAFKTDIVQPIDLDVPDFDVFWLRWPMRLELGVVVPVGKVEIGGTAGPVVDIWTIDGLAYPAADERATGDQVDLSVCLAARVRVRIAGFFAIFADAGVDIFLSRTSFELGGNPLAEHLPAQPRIVLGVAGVVRLPNVEEGTE